MGRGVNPETGRPGPAPAPPRDGDKKQARQRINVEVRAGHRPHPNTLPCTDCGHAWKPGERRHEYDHFLGYEAAHHYDVQAVCTTCHAAREVARGPVGARRAAGMKWCGDCRTEHPAVDFGKDRSRRDGLMTRCRAAESRRAVEKWAKTAA